MIHLENYLSGPAELRRRPDERRYCRAFWHAYTQDDQDHSPRHAVHRRVIPQSKDLAADLVEIIVYMFGDASTLLHAWPIVPTKASQVAML